MGNIPKMKEHRQVKRTKRLFKHRTQNLKNTYGQRLNGGQNSPLTDIFCVEGSDKLSEEQKQILEDGQRPTSYGETPTEEQWNLAHQAAGVEQYLATFGRWGGQSPHVKGEPPSMSKEQLQEEPSGKVYELRTEMQTLSEQLRVAQMTAEQINQIVLKNSQLKEEQQEMETMKETLAGEMDDFTKMKESLVSNHKDMERTCNDLVGTKAKEEKEKVRKNIDALQDMLTSMGCDQKRLRLGFQGHFEELATEFQYVRNEMEVNDKLLQERRQQFREYQELAQKFNTLAQKIKDMEEKLKATRGKFQRVQISLVSNQKALTEATEEKDKLQHERDSTEAEWIAEQQVWGIEKSAMVEDFRNQMGTQDRDWMDEREDLFEEKKTITEKLFTAQNRGEDLDDELIFTNTLMQNERKALAEAETTLEKCEAENTKLRDESTEKEESIVNYRTNITAKTTEVKELKSEVKKLTKELDRLLDRSRRRFTLKGLMQKHFKKAVDELIIQSTDLCKSGVDSAEFDSAECDSAEFDSAET